MPYPLKNIVHPLYRSNRMTYIPGISVKLSYFLDEYFFSKPITWINPKGEVIPGKPKLGLEYDREKIKEQYKDILKSKRGFEEWQVVEFWEDGVLTSAWSIEDLRIQSIEGTLDPSRYAYRAMVAYHQL